MTDLQKLEIRAAELRTRLSDLGGMDELTDETRSEMDTLRREYQDNDRKQTALKIAGDAPGQPTLETRSGPEGREYREMRNAADFSRYVQAAMSGNGVTNGAEAELNAHKGIEANYFPLEMLAGPLETRAARDGDAEAMQGTWLDRVFHGTAAERVGISFRPVAPGVAAYPVTTAGGDSGQQGRTQAVTESTYTVAVTEIKPARRALHGIYSIEDDMRLPGLADAIERDMRMAMTEGVDRAVFNGDTGANENTADITGLQTAGIAEFTLTQANKVKADETLKAFLAHVDGQYASSLADLRVVVSVGSNVLWYGSIHNSAADNQTIAQFLMASGMTWMTRGGIDTNTANGDFGAYLGLDRGIDGAGIAAVWEQAQLVRDPYSGASKGEVQLTLNYLWQLAFPRTSNFKRFKYVS